MTPSVQDLYAVCEATWPPARRWQESGWVLRNGAEGGKRVSAATRASANAKIAQAEAHMDIPLFMIREGEHDLDTALEARGYQIVDPVNLYLCPIKTLADVKIPLVTAFAVWEPLAIMEEIWAQGGIDTARRAVMARAKTKVGILSRLKDKPAGVAFAGLHNGTCMMHAIEVLPHQRRQGAAGWMMRKAAEWAAGLGAQHMSVLCTQENKAANALYISLGMHCVGQYHYRMKKD
jgi:GNAT superfamily N-acetyltransferase